MILGRFVLWAVLCSSLLTTQRMAAQEDWFSGHHFVVPAYFLYFKDTVHFSLFTQEVNYVEIINPFDSTSSFRCLQKGEVFRLSPDTILNQSRDSVFKNNELIGPHTLVIKALKPLVVFMEEVNHKPSATGIQVWFGNSHFFSIPVEKSAAQYQLLDQYRPGEMATLVANHNGGNTIHYDIPAGSSEYNFGPDSSVVLPPFHTFQEFSAYHPDYRDGSIISGLKPFSLIVNQISSADSRPCSNYSQISSYFYENFGTITFAFPDTSKAGRRFYITPYANQIDRFVQINLLATKDDTQVQFENGHTISLDYNEHYDTCTLQPMVIRSDKPILATQTSMAYAAVDTPLPQQLVYSGLQWFLQNENNFIQQSFFSTAITQVVDSHYVNLICPVTDTMNFTHNGQPWQNLGFKPYAADSTMAYAYARIDSGQHLIKNPGGFIGYHYGVHYNLTGTQNQQDSGEAYAFTLPGLPVSEAEDTVFQYSVTGETFQPFAGGEVELCAGDSVRVVPPRYRFIDWQWQSGGGDTAFQSIENHLPDTLIFRYEEGGNFILGAHNLAGGCFGKMRGDSLDIKVIELPAPEISARVESSCETSTLFLS